MSRTSQTALRRFGPIAGVLLVAATLVLRPVASGPFSYALGGERTEAPRHFWGLWAAAAHLGEWGPFVAHLEIDHPTGYTRHLMDPINLVPFLPPYWLLGGVEGAVAGYNLVHVFWAVLGGLGGWLLVRRLLRDEDDIEIIALVAAFACATAPYLMATPYLGRTELLPGVAYPLHLFFLHRALSRDGRWWDVPAAGLSLAAIALGGWYLAAWLAMLEPPLALWFARRGGRGWRSAGTIAAVALIAVIPVLPALHALFAYPPPVLGEEQRISVHMGICTPPQLLLPFVGNQGLPGTDLPAYPGTVLFVLAAVGAALRREARPWFGLALALLVLSLGPYLVWTNDASALQQDPIPLPAWFVEKALPPLRFIWGWCRLGILVTWPLAVAAAWGLVPLLRRLGALRNQVLIFIVVAIAVDHVHDRAPAGIDTFAFDAHPPPLLVEGLAQLPEGAILQLPLDDFYMTWQLGHGRPIAESLEIEDVRATSFIVQQSNRLIEALRDGEDAPFDSSDPQVVACFRDDALELAREGYAGVVLHRDRLPDAHLQMTQLLTGTLGNPAYDQGVVGVWTLQGEPAPAGVECPLAEVEVIIAGAPGGEGEEPPSDP